MSENQPLVLIIDEGIFRDRLYHEIERLGWKTVTAADQSDGLPQLRQLLPDLVIVDPTCGLTIEEIRRENPTVPIMVITYPPSTEDVSWNRDPSRERIRYLEEGADRYLPKPLNIEEAIAHIKALLRKHAF